MAMNAKLFVLRVYMNGNPSIILDDRHCGEKHQVLKALVLRI